jgi:hypothetical protein
LIAIVGWFCVALLHRKATTTSITPVKTEAARWFLGLIEEKALVPSLLAVANVPLHFLHLFHEISNLFFIVGLIEDLRLIVVIGS